ncbi:hypothetical protein OPV22_030179 [Ensete ventricosum]|uniref:Uncharacterized protein n=1 Tax=Ensete ventricosum TaxID=4639 RepID=A0AAV8P5V4_ENSVE|nr:hypothetical protein OPV22_030179 [Ensete ventricosum]
MASGFRESVASPAFLFSHPGHTLPCLKCHGPTPLEFYFPKPQHDMICASTSLERFDASAMNPVLVV